MTLHIVYDHQCSGCGADCIPYDDEVPCPKCGVVEAERFDYIQQAVDSLRFNKSGGSYTPPVWWVGSLGDHIPSLLFAVFDAGEDEHPASFPELAEQHLSRMDWGEDQYLRQHVLEIAVRIHRSLKTSEE